MSETTIPAAKSAYVGLTLRFICIMEKAGLILSVGAAESGGWIRETLRNRLRRKEFINMAECVDRLKNGVTVWQVTDEPNMASNIYCERSYASPDGRRFLYARREADSTWEYMLCEFGSWDSEPVGRGELTGSVSHQGDFYYARENGGKLEFVRVDLDTGASGMRFVISDAPGRGYVGHPTVSPDGRYLAFHRAISYDPQLFGIFLIDRKTGVCSCICEDPEICNAHSQFDAGTGHTILVQHNRGCVYAANGTSIRTCGQNPGCTLFLLDVSSGGITRLPIGSPYTAPLTGHETWIGKSDEIIFTVRPIDGFTETEGNILTIKSGESYRQITPGVVMNHIGTTPCGRYFHADGGPSGSIIVGSPRTGRFVAICKSHSNFAKKFGQHSHAHAALSPDFRWVVFNSDRTGRPQTYAASVPKALLEGLD